MYAFALSMLAGAATGYLAKLFTPKVKQDKQKQKYGWALGNPEGEGNVLPLVYGGPVKCSPLILQQWMDGPRYSGKASGDEWMNLLAVVGEGPVHGVSDVRLNGQAIADIAGASYAVRLGTADQEPIAGCDQIVSHFEPQGGRHELRQGQKYVWETQGEVDAVRIAVAFPALFRQGSNKSKIDADTLNLVIAVAVILLNAALSMRDTSVDDGEGGSGGSSNNESYAAIALTLIMSVVGGIVARRNYDDYTKLHDNTVRLRLRWADEGQSFSDSRQEYFDVTDKTRAEFSYHIYKAFDTKSRRRFELTRFTDDWDEDDKRQGQSFLRYWEEIQSGLLTYPHTAYLHIRAKATSAFSGGRPTVTCLVDGREVPDFVQDVRTGGLAIHPTDTVYSNNPAYAVADLLSESRRFGAGNLVGASAIHHDSWAAYRDHCATIAPFVLFNQDTGQYETLQLARTPLSLAIAEPDRVWEIVQEIAAASESWVYFDGGQVRFLPDKRWEGPWAYRFDDSNICVSDSGETSWEEVWTPPSERPNVIAASFLDADDDYERTTRSYAHPDLGDQPRVERTLQLYGIVHEPIVRRICMRLLRQAQAVGATVAWESGPEAEYVQPGDVVLVARSGDLGCGGTARKLTIVLDEHGAPLRVDMRLDRPVYVEAGRTYQLDLYRPGDSVPSRTRTFVPDEDAWLDVLETNIDTDDDLDADWYDVQWTLASEGSAPRPYRIFSVDRYPEGRVRLTASEYVDAVYTEDESLVLDETRVDQIGLVSRATLEGDQPVRLPLHYQLTSPDQPPYVESVVLTEDTRTINGAVVTGLVVEFGEVAMPAGSPTHIARYDVWYREQGTEKWIQSGPCRRGPYVIPALDAEVTYEVVVCPVTSSYRTVDPQDAYLYGRGELELTGKLPRLPAPSLLVYSHLSDGRMRVEWQPVEDASVRQYAVYVDGVAEAVVPHPTTRAVLDGRLAVGTHVLQVMPVDVSGQQGHPAQTIVEIAPVGAPDVSVAFIGGEAVYTYTPGLDGTYARHHWVLAYGDTVLAHASSGRIAIQADWLGTRRLRAYAVDIAGNPGIAASAVAEIVPPGQPTSVTLTDRGIQVEYSGTGTLDQHIILVDPNVEGEGEVVAESPGTHLPHPDYDSTFAVYVVDAVGRRSLPVSVTVQRSGRYGIVSSYRSRFDVGQRVNAHAGSGALVGPVDTAETWAQHWAGLGATTLQNAVDQGLVRLTEPTPGASSYQEDVDLGRLYPADAATSYNVVCAWDVAVGASGALPTAKLQVWQSADGLAWQLADTRQLSTAETSVVIARPHDTDLRYVRLRVDMTSSGDDLWRLRELGVDVLRAVEHNATGSVAITDPSAGYFVSLPSAIAIKSVQLTPESKPGQPMRFASYEVADDAYPGGVRIYVSDVHGNLTTGRVSYTITYY